MICDEQLNLHIPIKLYSFKTFLMEELLFSLSAELIIPLDTSNQFNNKASLFAP